MNTLYMNKAYYETFLSAKDNNAYLSHINATFLIIPLPPRISLYSAHPILISSTKLMYGLYIRQENTYNKILQFPSPNRLYAARPSRRSHFS